VLVVATLATTVTRYAALATWVFRTGRKRDRRGAAITLPTQGA
jgi:hypothetical protein